MTLLESPTCTCFPEDDAPLAPGVYRSANEMSSSILLRNGNTVDLAGTSHGMTWPPNYLEDLRAGRL